MVSNILTHSFEWPGVAQTLAGSGGTLGWLQVLAYPLVIGLAIWRVWNREDLTLRQDAKLISDFNATLVRWALFAVLFIGLADMIISFLRVEGLLEYIVGKQLTTDLGRSAFRGPWVHIPLMILALRDEDPYVRKASMAALRGITSQDFGFDPEASASQRETRVKQWERWWSENRAKLLKK